MDKEQLQTLYQREDYYWGKEPNALAKRILDHVPQSQRVGAKLVDLGAGEGRDSVFLAQQGFDVLAVDIAPAGLDKARKLAAECDVKVNVLEADINDVKLPKSMDVLYSIGTLQYIEPQRRSRQFEHFKAQTAPNGLHVLFAFINHPDVATAPDWGQNEFLFERGALKQRYADWNILHDEEYIFECHSSGIAHQHAADILIARKPIA